MQRKATQFYWETKNSERQIFVWREHGHVVISAVCRERHSKFL